MFHIKKIVRKIVRRHYLLLETLFFLFVLPVFSFAVSCYHRLYSLFSRLGILGESFGIRNALLAVLLFVLLSGIVSSVTRENITS